jgi:hypothetical protein
MEKVMLKKYSTPLCIAICLFMFSCSRKQVPQHSSTTATAPTAPAGKPEVKKRAPAVAAPKVISVGDMAAKKNIDGRLYYDLDGRRYWKNYDDGKYYLFNKSMYTDPAFKPH